MSLKNRVYVYDLNIFVEAGLLDNADDRADENVIGIIDGVVYEYAPACISGFKLLDEYRKRNL